MLIFLFFRKFCFISILNLGNDHIYLFISLLIYLFTYSFIYLFVYSLIFYLFTYLFIYLLYLITCVLGYKK